MHSPIRPCGRAQQYAPAHIYLRGIAYAGQSLDDNISSNSFLSAFGSFLTTVIYEWSIIAFSSSSGTAPSSRIVLKYG